MVVLGLDTHLLERTHKQHSPKEMALLIGSEPRQQVRHKGLIHCKHYANLLRTFVHRRLQGYHRLLVALLDI
jgi:hypothetical protein